MKNIVLVKGGFVDGVMELRDLLVGELRRFFASVVR
jgi:hypothetical protein